MNTTNLTQSKFHKFSLNLKEENEKKTLYVNIQKELQEDLYSLFFTWYTKCVKLTNNPLDIISSKLLYEHYIDWVLKKKNLKNFEKKKLEIGKDFFSAQTFNTIFRMFIFLNNSEKVQEKRLTKGLYFFAIKLQ